MNKHAISNKPENEQYDCTRLSPVDLDRDDDGGGDGGDDDDDGYAGQILENLPAKSGFQNSQKLQLQFQFLEDEISARIQICQSEKKYLLQFQ